MFQTLANHGEISSHSFPTSYFQLHTLGKKLGDQISELGITGFDLVHPGSKD